MARPRKQTDAGSFFIRSKRVGWRKALFWYLCQNVRTPAGWRQKVRLYLGPVKPESLDAAIAAYHAYESTKAAVASTPIKKGIRHEPLAERWKEYQETAAFFSVLQAKQAARSVPRKKRVELIKAHLQDAQRNQWNLHLAGMMAGRSAYDLATMKGTIALYPGDRWIHKLTRKSWYEGIFGPPLVELPWTATMREIAARIVALSWTEAHPPRF